MRERFESDVNCKFTLTNNSVTTTRRLAARTMANSIDNTNTANASSMVLSSSSSAAIATSMANDDMMGSVNMNTSTTTNTNASTMASVESMMANATCTTILPALTSCSCWYSGVDMFDNMIDSRDSQIDLDIIHDYEQH